ncbi:MAG TPA: zf-HC2 domain-containing protein [Thermoleophilia bacterium]|nr:zf-HC2 domain-containing protein [Thermoleophilia bacterium]
MTWSDDCLSNEQLFFYSEGLLDADETRRVATHLRSCEPCAVRYRAEIEFTVALRELPAPLPSPAMPSRVIQKIRAARSGRVSTWWWVVAFGLLVASGLRWLVVGGFSPQKGVESLTAFLWSATIALLQLVTRFGDLETWRQVGRSFVTVAEAAGASPVWLASSVVAAVMVAVATNVLLWKVARRALAR